MNFSIRNPLAKKTVVERTLHQPTSIQDNLENVYSTAAARARDVTNPQNNYFSSMWTIPYQQLENIYMTTWVGKKIVEIPTEYIFKNGFTLTIKGKPELEQKVLDYYKERGLEERVKQALTYKYIYGGCIILPKDKSQDPSKPYNYKQFKGKEIEFIVRDLSYMAVIPHVEIVSEKYFEPKNISLAGLYMDAENCMLFKGIRAPLRRMPQFRYLGMSVFQNIFEALINDQYITKGITNMVYRGNMKYYKLEGLNELVKQKKESLAVERICVIENVASMLSAGILDAKDSVEWVQQGFASLADIDERSLTRLSAATNIPAMVLLGKSPDSSGMGQSQRPELENFYDFIGKEQNQTDPLMCHLFRIIINILNGDDVDFEFKFNPPENIDKKTQIDVDTAVLNNLKAMEDVGFNDEVIKRYAVEKGVITSEEADSMDELQRDMLEASSIDEDDTQIDGE